MDSKGKAAAVIDAIAAEAQAIWGEQWQSELVRAYCEIESSESGKIVKPVTRRSQVMRVLEAKATTLETTIRLAQAVRLTIGAETLLEFY